MLGYSSGYVKAAFGKVLVSCQFDLVGHLITTYGNQAGMPWHPVRVYSVCRTMEEKMMSYSSFKEGDIVLRHHVDDRQVAKTR
jgi:hypothetical protein